MSRANTPRADHEFVHSVNCSLTTCVCGLCERCQQIHAAHPRPEPVKMLVDDGVTISHRPIGPEPAVDHEFEACEVPDYCERLVWDADGKRTCGLPRSAHPRPEPAERERTERLLQKWEPLLRRLADGAEPAEREPDLDDAALLANLMDGLREVQYAEARLENALCAALGWDYEKRPCWKWGDDWWFDTYDSSVELVGAIPGSKLTDDERAKLLAAGISMVWVTYSDGTAWTWSTFGKGDGGPCSPRKIHDEPRGTLLAEALAKLKTAKAEGRREGLEEAAKVATGMAMSVAHHGAKWETAADIQRRIRALAAEPGGSE